MSWRLSGTYFENCNCNVTCPCAVSGFSEPADNERCIVLLAFHVDSGEIDGVDVSDLSYAVVADAPGAMAQGNWRVGLLMDSAASPEQAEALAAVASGQRGGAPAAFNPFIGEVRGMDAGPGTDLGAFGWFVGIWVTMMAAMMLPAAAPAVLMFASVRRGASTWLFVLGYLLAWTGYGLAAFAVYRGIRAAAPSFFA